MGKKTTPVKRRNTQFSKEDFEHGDYERIAELSGYSKSLVVKVLQTGERNNKAVVDFTRRYLDTKRRLREELLTKLN